MLEYVQQPHIVHPDAPQISLSTTRPKQEDTNEQEWAHIPNRMDDQWKQLFHRGPRFYGYYQNSWTY